MKQPLQRASRCNSILTRSTRSRGAVTQATASHATPSQQLRQRRQRPQQQQDSQQHQHKHRNQASVQHDALQCLHSWAADQLPQFMPTQQQWQPSDLLPDPSADSFLQQMSELRREAQQLPTDALVVLAGVAVNAAVVSNQLSSSWGGAAGFRDETGAQTHPWARWRRTWAADTNRHRALLSSYCYCCGCFDMHAIDTSTQLSISAGCFNGGPSCWATPDSRDRPLRAQSSPSGAAHQSSSAALGRSSAAGRGGGGGGGGGAWQSCESELAGAGAGLPYPQLFRELLQGRMVRVMHENMSRLAVYHGAPVLGRIMASIAVDARRHELALVAALRELFEMDGEGAICAFASVVRDGMMLPGCYMQDGWHDRGNAGTAAAAAAKVQQAALDLQQMASCNVSADRALTGASSACQETLVPEQPAHQQQQEQEPGLSAPPPHSASSLYQDFMAAADCLGVYTLNDMATAAEQCCQVWQVPRLSQQTSRLSAAARESAEWLLAYPAQLRRLTELQLEGRLRLRRRGRARTASFSWVFKREVLLS